jgi:hypothetical protein
MEAPAIPTIVNVLVSLDTAGTVVNTVFKPFFFLHKMHVELIRFNIYFAYKTNVAALLNRVPTATERWHFFQISKSLFI